MIKDILPQLAEKKDLAPLQIEQVMEEILTGSADTADIVTFLTCLSAKGETVEELTAAVKVMLKHVDPILVDRLNILDTCGTGGDNKGTFNISTATAFVASGAGVTVAKHGNRSVSSKCGSADCLEALGVTISMDKAKIKKCLEEIGIAFLFAPNLHPAMKHVMPARKQIARRTMFNIIGPLINPAKATNQLIGVFSQEWATTLAMVLYNLGKEHVLLVHGNDGLDEVTTTDTTVIAEVNRGKFSESEIGPEDFGFTRARLDDLAGGDAPKNAQIITEILKGKCGPQRDIVLLNAGCAIYAADKAVSIEKGIVLARHSLDSGCALKKLEFLKEWSK
jgi:anthranilate phosphoribosyltransferase